MVRDSDTSRNLTTRKILRVVIPLAFLLDDASIDYANSNPEEAAALIEQYGIVPKAAVAQAAIPQANMVCVTGEDMKGIADYYQVLFDADPTSIGGAIPGEDFYYIP